MAGTYARLHARTHAHTPSQHVLAPRRSAQHWLFLLAAPRCDSRRDTRWVPAGVDARGAGWTEYRRAGLTSRSINKRSIESENGLRDGRMLLQPARWDYPLRFRHAERWLERAEAWLRLWKTPYRPCDLNFTTSLCINRTLSSACFTHRLDRKLPAIV